MINLIRRLLGLPTEEELCRLKYEGYSRLAEEEAIWQFERDIGAEKMRQKFIRSPKYSCTIWKEGETEYQFHLWMGQ
jgi:hypothetical protein